MFDRVIYWIIWCAISFIDGFSKCHEHSLIVMRYTSERRLQNYSLTFIGRYSNSNTYTSYIYLSKSIYVIFDLQYYVVCGFLFSDLSYLIFTLEKKLKEVNLWQGDVKFIPCYKHSYFLNHSTKFNQISNSNWKFVWANVDISVYITRSVVHCVTLLLNQPLYVVCVYQNQSLHRVWTPRRAYFINVRGKWVIEYDMTFFDKTGARKEKANIYTRIWYLFRKYPLSYLF